MQTDNTLPYFGERLQTIRETLNLKRPAFAQLIDVGKDTVARAEIREKEKSNDYIISQIERKLPAAADYLKGITDSLPSDFFQTSVTTAKPSKSTTEKDGEKLLNYLSRKGITQSDLAKVLGKSQPMINHYTKSATIRPDIKADIAKAVNATESQIWPKPVTSAPRIADLIALPILDITKRSSMAPHNFSKWLLNYDHLNSDVYYLKKGDIPNNDINNAFVVEISRIDNMQPLLPPNSLAVGVLLNPDQYDSIINNYVLIAVGQNIMVRRLSSNSLRTSDIVQLSTLEGYGANATFTVKRSDIEFMAVLKKAIIDL